MNERVSSEEEQKRSINSAKLLKKPLLVVPKFIVVLLLILAAIGFGVATYLTVKHLQGGLPSCAIVNGCQSVLTSKYASVGLVPTAVFGMGYYLAVFSLGILYLSLCNPLVIRLIGWLTVVGFGVSLYLIYLQLWVIDAVCLYCMTSAAVCILMFVIDLVVWKKYLRAHKDGENLVVTELV